MQVNNVLSNQPRALRAPKQPDAPPPQEPKGDGWCKAGTAGVAVLTGAGLGYAGAHGGAVAGGLLGLMLTQPGSGLGDPGLLGNIGTGLQVGAISGALIGFAGGISLVYLISEALKSPQA